MEDLVTEFNGLLARPFRNGDYFDIDVVLAKNPKRFHIKFASDKLNKNPNTTIEFEVDINGKERYVRVQSTMAFEEEISRFAAEKDEINIKIMYFNDMISLSMNEKDISKITLDRPYDPSFKINALQIVGDIKFIERVDHRSSFPALWPPSKFIPHNVDRMCLSNDIPVKFQPGHLMVLTARCYGSSDGNFFINMKHANNETLIMQFKVDFRNQLVYRSHWNQLKRQYDMTYCYESAKMLQQDGGFPFDFSKTFKIGIACKEKEFLIAVNGEYFCSYSYGDGHSYGEANKGLENIVGPKIFWGNGYEGGIKVTSIDHILLDNPECTTFESYTKLERADVCDITNV
ncbi:uncharacterized protein [Musca autumnalis]|uniref:uncharacterized protein n=1 Tax=Musca autumnalis TaxID=221902 RepID=UPI003CEFD5A4